MTKQVDAFQRQLMDRIKLNLHHFSKQVTEDVEKFTVLQNQLELNHSIVQQAIQSFELEKVLFRCNPLFSLHIQQKLDENIAILESKEKELTTWLEESERKPLPPVDEVVTPADALSSQYSHSFLCCNLTC